MHTCVSSRKESNMQKRITTSLGEQEREREREEKGGGGGKGDFHTYLLHSASTFMCQATGISLFLSFQFRSPCVPLAFPTPPPPDVQQKTLGTVWFIFYRKQPTNHLDFIVMRAFASHNHTSRRSQYRWPHSKSASIRRTIKKHRAFLGLWRVRVPR